jgi:hypothetical protein
MTLEEVFGQWRVIGERKYEIFHKIQGRDLCGSIKSYLNLWG